MSQRRRDFHNRVDRTRSCLVDRAVAATGASVFDFHGSHRRKLIILRQKGYRGKERESGSNVGKRDEISPADAWNRETKSERESDTLSTAIVRSANKTRAT